MTRTILFTLILSLLSVITKAQVANDCANADCLQSNAPFTDVVFDPGNPDPVTGCLQFGENQVHWFAFEALNSGTFEMLITPIGLGADYDFAIYQGGCPDDGGALFVCNWEGPISPGPYYTTGIASDPVGSFGANANPINPNPQDEWEPTTSLTQGQIYYLVLDNITANGVGFSIQFGGSAAIGPPSPPTTPPGPITGPMQVCEGDTETYSVPPVDGATLTWSGPNDAILTPNGNTVTVTWGATSGDLCVTAEVCDITGPPGCLPVIVSPVPTISILPPGPACESEFDLSTLTIVGLDPLWTVTYHGSQGAAENGSPELPSPIVNTSGTYWIRVESGPGCYDIASVNITLEQPDIIAEVDPDAVFCEPAQVDLSSVVTVTELTGLTGLTITFHYSQPDAVNGFPAIIPPIVDVSGIYWVRAETPTGCFDVEFIEINIDPQPVIQVEQPDPVCTPPLEFDLSTVNITVTNGNPNNTTYLYYTNYNDALAGINQLFNPFVTQSGTYYVVGVSPNGCTSEPQPIEVVIGGEITATLSGSGTLCPGDNATLTIDFEGGMPPFDLVLEDDQGNQYTINTSNDPHIEDIPIDQTTTFQIISFTDSGSGDCPATFDGTATFDVVEPPEATLLGGESICCGEEALLEFALTGTGPFTIEYEDDITGTVVTLTDINDGHTEIVAPCTHTTYSLVSVTDAAGCEGTVSGDALIEMHDDPVVNNLVELPCVGLEYSIQFEISGGSGNYTVEGDAGTLNGNMFTSDPIPGGEPYTFSVYDENACDTLILTDTVECNCGTFAGTMPSNPLDLCEGETASPMHNGNAFLEPEDTILFILHTSGGGMLGTILSTNVIPDFSFDPAVMSYDTTYYISALAGDDDGTGNVDMNDPCLDVTPGTPVTWHRIPNLSLSGGNPVCPGDSTQVQFDFTGTGPFTVIYQINGAEDSIQTNDNSFVLNIPVNSAGNIDVLSVNSPYCNRPLTESLSLDVLSSPQVNNISYVCNSTNTAYTVNFTITGGSGTGYQVSGGSGTLSGSDFISDEIVSGSAETFLVIDDNVCDTIEIQAMFNCDCGTLTGSVDQTQEELCEGEVIQVEDLGGSMLDGNDVLEFILHDQAGNTIGTVAGRNNTGQFGFDPTTMSLGQVYYISLVAGDDTGNGQVDLTDPCLSVSQGKPVRWHGIPTADIQVMGSGVLTCQVSQVSMDGAGSTGSNALSYNWSTTNGVIDGASNGASVNVSAPGDYQLVVTDQVAGCADSTIVTITSDGSIPEVNIASPGTLTCITTQLTLDASGSTQGQDILINWSANGGNIISGANSLMPVIDAPGQYTLTLTDTTNDCTASGSVTVMQDNAGLNAVIAVSDVLDCNTSQVELDGGGSSVGQDIVYTWTTLNGNILGGTTGMSATATEDGTYILIVEDQSSGCMATDTAEVQQNGLVPTDLDITVVPISCNGQANASIQINNVEGGTPPYQFSLNGGTLSSQPSFSGLAEGTYSLLVEDASGCTFQTSVTIEEPQELEVRLGDDIFIELGDSVQLEAIVNQPVDTFIWTGNIDRRYQGMQNPTVSPVVTTMYTVTVITQGGCLDEDQQLVIVERERPAYTPNVFSPNNDGINDYFMIYGGEEIEEIQHLRIYTRWGELVYENKNLVPGDEPEGWDGRFMGEEMNPGVYIYTAEVLFKDGVLELLRGDLSLIR